MRTFYPASLALTVDVSSKQNRFVYLAYNPTTSFRIVSCGHPEVEGLAFRELVKVFDMRTWAFVLVTGYL